MSSKEQLTTYVKKLKKQLKEKEAYLYDQGIRLARTIDERDELKKLVKKLEEKTWRARFKKFVKNMGKYND